MRIIAGQWRGRRLSPVRTHGIRPTSDRVREAWMSIVGMDLPDARVVDLFAGSGALGLEALSRGAAHTTFVENAQGSLRVLEANIKLVGAEQKCSVVRGDALAFLDRGGLPVFDLVFADPPYGKGLAAAVLGRFRTKPFADCLWVEHRSREELPELSGADHRRYGDTTLTGVYRSDHVEL